MGKGKDSKKSTKKAPTKNHIPFVKPLLVKEKSKFVFV